MNPRHLRPTETAILAEYTIVKQRTSWPFWDKAGYGGRTLYVARSVFRTYIRSAI
ncbi:unnamed protein product [Penicillium roqueforti FM164]|uniref:Uncharacterized protein n=1 Tax=Penicillium roqueforti (strain FM164) TaxID=1365484 RepID=W6QN10_PENRF|nr:unnamed protein product [Penicillium roqueforti FM164]